MRNINLLTIALVSIFALEGCAGGMGMGSNYPTQSSQYGNGSYSQTQSTQSGVITNVRQIAMQSGGQSGLPVGTAWGCCRRSAG